MKNSKLLSLGLSLGLASMLFTGCSDDADAVALDPAPAVLKGTWLSGCFSESAGESEEYKVVVSDGKIVFTESGYRHDEACTTLDQTIVYTNDVQYGDERTLAGAGEAVYNMDGTNVVMTLTPITAANADEHNTAVRCGHSDWAAGVPKVLNDNCLGGDAATIAEEIADWYNIAGVLPSDDKLYSGDDEGAYDGTTAALRPITLMANGMTKQ